MKSKGQNVFEEIAEVLFNQYLLTDFQKKLKAHNASLYFFMTMRLGFAANILSELSPASAT